MSEKTYQSTHGNYSLSYKPNDGGRPIQFVTKAKGHGEYTTKDGAIQAYIEKSTAYKAGEIRVKWSKVQKAQAKYDAAKEASNASAEALKDAEDTLKAARGAEKAPKTEKAKA